MIDGHRRLPGQARCEDRERNGAVAGIAACLLLATTIALVAVLSAPPVPATGHDAAAAPEPRRDAAPGGRGASDATVLAVKGPGGGSAGGRSGAAGTEVDDAARGMRTAAPGTSDSGIGEGAGGRGEPLPEIGFSVSEPESDEGARVGEPDGRDGAGAAGGGASLMGIRTDARTVVYVLDHSASMRDARERVLDAEMRSAIEGLPKDARFAVILFGRSASQGASVGTHPNGAQRLRTAIPMPPGQLVDARPANRAKAIKWLADTEPDAEGSSVPWDAMQQALALDPEAIFLLTDGEFMPDDTADLEDVIKASRSRARIHTVAFGSSGDIDSLRRISAASGGTYRRIELPQPSP